MSNSITKPEDCFLYRRKEINYVNMPVAYLDVRYGNIPGGGLKGYVLIVKPSEPNEYIVLSECAVLENNIATFKRVLDGLFDPINIGKEINVHQTNK
jgi:hypothetical protein